MLKEDHLNGVDGLFRVCWFPLMIKLPSKKSSTVVAYKKTNEILNNLIIRLLCQYRKHYTKINHKSV